MESCQALGFLRTDWNLGILAWLSVLEDLFAWEMMLDFGQQNRSSFYSPVSPKSGLVKNMQVLEELHFQSSFVIITCQAIALVRELYLLFSILTTEVVVLLCY